MTKPARPPRPSSSIKKSAVPVSRPVQTKPPVAPPVYRPQVQPKVLQRKVTVLPPQPANKTKSVPVAPNVFRPPHIVPGVQLKKPAAQPSAPPSRKAPVAPPAYRPGAVPKVLQRKISAPPSATPQLQRNPTVSSGKPSRLAPKGFQPQAAVNRPPLPRQTIRPVSTPVASATHKKIVQPKPAPRLQNHALNRSAGFRSPVIQRTIDVQNVDFDPVANEFRHGFVNQAGFYQNLRESIMGSAPFELYRNQLHNVMTTVSGQDFSNPDVDTLTTAITGAVRNAYQGRGQPVNSANLIATLTGFVRTALVGNIQPDHQTAMSAEEGNAFDALAQANNAVLSRAKGVPNTIPYGSLPAAVRLQVDARIAEILAEKARWNRAAIGPEYTVPNNTFAMEITTRQRDLHYQGNHSNLAGWLPQAAAPIDRITPLGDAIYNRASRKLQTILQSDDPLRRMDYVSAGGQNRPNRYRVEYERLRTQALIGINDQAVKLSAMAALCGGVSAYIEFSMAGDISRLMYNPINGRIYITAHYKWRQGYNPFFKIDEYPVI